MRNDIPYYPLLVVGTVKGGTASAAKWFNLVHETVDHVAISLRGGLSSGLIYPSADDIWRDTRTDKIVGRFAVVIAITRIRMDHLGTLMENAQYLPIWYPGQFRQRPSVHEVERWLFNRSKVLANSADKIIPVETIPEYIK